MFPKDENKIRRMVDGNSLDFFLEDDMFEIEGLAHVENDSIIVDVKDAVGHVLSICGKELEVSLNEGILKAKRIDTGKVFHMEINRIYKKLHDPQVDDFLTVKQSNRVNHFFKKETDTLIWYEEKSKMWCIELNKINMFFSGDRKSYHALEELFIDNEENISGLWQAVSYSSEVDYEEANYDQYCDSVRI